jgi:hypothetical protein
VVLLCPGVLLGEEVQEAVRTPRTSGYTGEDTLLMAAAFTDRGPGRNCTGDLWSAPPPQAVAVACGFGRCTGSQQAGKVLPAS